MLIPIHGMVKFLRLGTRSAEDHTHSLDVDRNNKMNLSLIVNQSQVRAKDHRLKNPRRREGSMEGYNRVFVILE